MAKNYKNILIIRLDKMGDVILSTPVIKTMREAFPNSRITFMVRPYTRQIVEGNPYLDEVLVYDKDRHANSITANMKFILKLRRKKFDLALILHPTGRTHILMFLAGIPERVGYDKKWGFLLTKRIPHNKQFGLKHEMDYTLDLVRYIGIKPGSRSLYISKNEECEKMVDGQFARSGIKDTDIVIAINPGASCPSRRWNTENFARVADGLVLKYNAKVIIIASQNDKALGDDIASKMEAGCLNLSGKTTISDIASILRRIRLFISNDSGPVHIACAVGAPVVVIFGRNDRGVSPFRWGPSGGNDIVLHKDVGCDICLAHNCKKGFECLEAITVDEVLAAADKILTKKVVTK
ncbi:MAG: lipopolysaccharide heptosyltransferase II [Candidatus Omnitrophota bacterium]|nr:lipopolysaccharide heptosyltransferase II [Candidatus Omnitrophota bacterium]